MKIAITKTNLHQCEYTITRDDQSVELINLDVKTFLLHDLTHFVVEQELGYTKGFWGMLAIGHSFTELFGKDNKLTAELRFIEKIVGPVQSVYAGNIPSKDFHMYIEHLFYNVNEHFLSNCLSVLNRITVQWKELAVGQSLNLEWNSVQG